MSHLSTSLIIPGDLQLALDFYTIAFGPHATVVSPATSDPANTFSIATITIYGHKFTLYNMGPEGSPSAATSFMITCHGGQEEVDSIWNALTQQGEALRCGWVKDRFGFFWQIIPKELEGFMRSGDAETGKRVMQAMLGMQKIDIEGLERAAAGDAGTKKG